jgi:hypothetical protein
VELAKLCPVSSLNETNSFSTVKLLPHHTVAWAIFVLLPLKLVGDIATLLFKRVLGVSILDFLHIPK